MSHNKADPEKRLEALRERMLNSVPVERNVQQQILDELRAIRKLLEDRFNG